MSTNNNPMKNS